MTPILFDSGTTEFSSNGLGKLADATSCTVTEERNGPYELEMTYPVSGALYQDIQLSAIILAKPSDGANEQPFRIYSISRPIGGIVTVNAEHISYQLTHIPCAPFTASTAAEAMAGLKSNAAEDCPFDFWTDKAASANFAVKTPASIRSRLGGIEGSILDIYGGEYEWDGYTVKLHASRGKDNGVLIKYGKNLTDLKQEESIQNTITGVYPYWASSEGELVQLPEKVILAPSAANYPYHRTIPLDLSAEFKEAPAEDALREAAESYISGSGIGTPTVSLTVSFVALWQTEEYQDIAPLERVGLCDTVAVEFEKLGVSAKAKVIKTVYNVLLERYDSIDLGEAKSNLATTIAVQQKTIEEKTSSSFLKESIDRATGWITGANGGSVILHKDGNGRLYEILVMDTDDIATAQSVWRWNKNGWGHSSTGYDGPFGTAATIDGQIVADFITAGTMLANRIKGGTLTLGGKDNGNGILEVLNEQGNEVCRISNTGLKTTEGEFSGTVEAKSGRIGPFLLDETGLTAKNSEGKNIAFFAILGENKYSMQCQETLTENAQIDKAYIKASRDGTATVDRRVFKVSGGGDVHYTITVKNGLIVGIENA